MKRIIRRVVTVVTTETWAVIEDQEHEQPDRPDRPSQLSLTEGTSADLTRPTTDDLPEDAGTSVPVRFKTKKRRVIE
jgi:hypothetical protein